MYNFLLVLLQYRHFSHHLGFLCPFREVVVWLVREVVLALLAQLVLVVLMAMLDPLGLL